MTDLWEQAEDHAEKSANDNSIFVRLSNNGDKVVGAFCGDPHPKEVHWTGERYEECLGDDCPHCAAGKKPNFRVALNFFVPAENAMKVFEGGSKWFKDVVKVRNKYGLESWLFEVERHGESGDPQTVYTILPEEKICDEVRASIEVAELHDLKALGRGKNGASEKVSTPTTNKPVSIDPRVAGELVASLKTLPRSDIDMFLSKFGVQRVRDLRSSDEPKARIFIEQLASKFVQSEQQEIDPFE